MLVGIRFSRDPSQVSVRGVVDRGTVLPWVGAVMSSDGEALAARTGRDPAACRVAVPAEPQARRRFLRDWVARNRRAMAAGFGGMVLLLPMMAQAAGEVALVQPVQGLVGASLQADGSVILTFADGRAVTVPADQVTVQADGRILIAPDVIEALAGAEAGAMALDAAGLALGGGLVLGMAAIAAGGGGGAGVGGGGAVPPPGDAPGSATPTPAPGPVTARMIPVVDGYLVDAFVFRDLNANGIWDSGEAYTTTDAAGAFDVNLLTGRGGLVAGTPNAAAIAQDASLAALRPIDLSTGQPFAGTLTAPDGADVVTPLTTLVDTLLRSDASLTAEQAAGQVAQALGLTGDLLTDDPVALAEAGSDAGLAQLQAAAQVAAIINVTTAAGGDAAAAIGALAGQIGAAEDGPVSLADPAVLGAVLGAAVTPEQVAALSDILADVNAALDSGRGLSAIEQVQGAVQGAIVEAVAAGQPVNVADTIAATTPLRPVITSAPELVNAAVAEGGITVSGTGRPGSVVSVSFGDLVETAPVDSLGAWSVTFAAAPADGAVALSARASIDGGPLGSAAPVVTVRVDTTAPAAPGLALAADTGQPGGVTANGAIVLSGVEDGGRVEYSTDAGATWGAGFAAAEGANSVQVRQADAAGNVSGPSAPLEFTLDTVAPVVTLDEPLPARIDAAEVAALEGAPAIISGTVSGVAEGTRVTMSFGPGTYEQATGPNGAFSFAVPVGDILALEGTGSAAIVITATDGAGNAGRFEAVLPVIGDLDGSETTDLLGPIGAAATLAGMEAALAAFAAAREIAIPDGMLPALAGDLLLRVPASYSLSFSADVLAASGTLAEGAPDRVSGTMTFRLPLDRTDDQLAQATRPEGVFQNEQGVAAGENALDVTIDGLRQGITSLRMDLDEVTQQDIDELGPEGIAALFGADAVLTPGPFTSLQIWLSAADGTQDPETGEFTIGGVEASINLFLPGVVGLEAFMDALARDDVTFKQFEIFDVNGAALDGEDDLVGEITAGFDSFTLSRTPGPVVEADLVEALDGQIALRTALDAVLDAANDGSLSAADLAALAAVLPAEDGAAPFLAGEQLSVAAAKAIVALANLPAAQLDPLLAAFNAEPGDGALESLSDLTGSATLFPALQPVEGGEGGGAVDPGAGDGLPASVLAMLEGETIADWTGISRSGVNLLQVGIAGEGPLGHEHWFVVGDGPDNPVIADHAFAQGDDRFLRGVVRSTDDAFYFQILNLSEGPGGTVQDPDQSLSIYRLDPDAVVPALNAAAASPAGGAAGMVDFVSGVSVLSLGVDDVGYGDLPAGTIMLAGSAGFLDEGEGAYRVAGAVQRFDIATGSSSDFRLYVTPVLDVNGAEIPGTAPLVLDVPGRLLAFDDDPDLGLLATFDVREGGARQRITYQVDAGAEGGPALGDEVVRGTAGNDDLSAIVGFGPQDAGTLILPSSGEDRIDLTGSGAADTIFYRAGFTDGPDLVTGFDTGADRIGYAVTASGTPSLSLTTVAAASSADADLIAALETYAFGAEDLQFVLLDPAGGDGPILLALTEPPSAGEPGALVTLAGVAPASFTLDNLLVQVVPPPEV